MTIPTGETRSAVASDHALISTDSHVDAALPGWTETEGVVLISPAMGGDRGPRFSQYLAKMEPGGQSGLPLAGVQRFVYVSSGRVETEGSAPLEPGGFLYTPPGTERRLTALEPSELIVFEKPYVASEPTGGPAPAMVMGNEGEIESEAFLGDPRAQLKSLLPDSDSYDMAVNLFSFEVGATLPFVEVHVMEHGLTFLAGEGVYRLGESWYRVTAGDTIWMAAYCPQWFAATGTEPARYLYYKDVRRDALSSISLAP